MKLDTSLHRVELHIHLDGSARASTIFELAQRRGISLSHSNLTELEQELKPTKPYCLSNFLQKFEYVIPVFAGDKEAIARLSEEFVEDCRNRSKLCYVETRFAPHLLMGDQLSADEVTMTVLDALHRAGNKYNVQVRLILCILRGDVEKATEVLDLAQKYRPHGVVGIDLAGDESVWMTNKFSDQIVHVFRRAKSDGIHRTVHAGENGPAQAVENAIDQLYAERIGHGYHVLDDARILQLVKQRNIHFELCPTSSILTGATNPESSIHHPLSQFVSHQMNYSINTDDPLMTGRWLDEEIAFCKTKLVPSLDVHKAQLNAANAAFLDSEEDRQILLDHVKRYN